MKKAYEMPLEELLAQETMLKKTQTLLILAVVLFAGAGAYLTLAHGFGVFTMLPLALIGALAVNSAQLKKIQNEILRRDVQI